MGEEILKDWIINLLYFFLNGSFFNLLRNMILPFLIYYLILYTFYSISLLKLYRDIKIKTKTTFIPMVHFYRLMQLLEIPFLYLLIPLINIVILLVLPYLICKKYQTPTYLAIISVFIPFILIPYVVYSNKYNYIIIENKEKYLKTRSDVEKLEDKLKENSKETLIIDENVNIKKTTKEFNSTIDQKIIEIENNAIKDNFYDELSLIEDKEKKDNIEKFNKEILKENNGENDNVDMIDTFDNYVGINISDIDQIEKDIDMQEEDSKTLDSDKQDYKEVAQKETTIAFGGIESREDIEKGSSQARDEHLKCPRCGSELEIGNNTCPGCGNDVSNIIFESKGEI